MSVIIHFGTDGWRARTDGDFTNEQVIRIADAVGGLWSQTGHNHVYVGFDTRPQAHEMAHLAAEVLAGYGLTAILSDRALPTPMLSWSCAQDPRSAGALMVTGSHHPMGYLGIKLRSADGGAVDDEFYRRLESQIAQDPSSARGIPQAHDLTRAYLAHITTLVDVKRIAAAQLSAICDPMYGAARGYLAQVLRDLGVQVSEIHAQEEPGWEDVRPEPTEPWVDDCERAVVGQKTNIGLVVDGDADRMGAVDNKGRFISSQTILALLLRHLVKHRKQQGRLVVNLSTSMLPRRVAADLGCQVTVKPIGFKYICEEMRKGDVLIGGEEAGGLGVPFHLCERDAIVCSLLLVEMLAWEQKSLAELIDELQTQYGAMSYARRDLRLPPETIEMLETKLPGLNPAQVAGKVPQQVSHLDGLRLDFDNDAWLLLRPSGTEAVVRVCAEAPNVQERDALLDAGSDIARGALLL
ncbi:phosphoglucomutase/phosphomannomutase family protein [Collinsella sp. zg1085]|uniref:phosphoglucomutase/phosphomannomutase family protein n=1 Tax=Collinsella sp. zg1085 TaxID=2844380 RepID=UPI001C0C9435|nr:phosphoglucomutase/phosphomannomutase family protein [Collinsella sp. zg1085]QWT17706.1 phosphoglucomutase/phosphomannomutase family protein [Collinsella sp. zg1085]